MVQQESPALFTVIQKRRKVETFFVQRVALETQERPSIHVDVQLVVLDGADLKMMRIHH